MESSINKEVADTGWLPDVNVWLALCSDRHEFHKSASKWLASIQAPVFFCRVTQMALLRLLTNPKVMGEDTLTPETAVGVYRDLLMDERVQYTAEPAEVEKLWFSFMAVPAAKGSVWTDAWLAAFALARGVRLVTFDSGIRRWRELAPVILKHDSLA